MMRLFMEIHSGNPREGPGDDESTLRALRMITGLPEFPSHPDILDVGCGPGMQTLALVRATGGMVTAVDIFPQFLEQLEHSATELDQNDPTGRVGGRIRTVRASMFELPFEPESFDLIWSEGAVYIMGFENGLREWGKFLRKGGAIAVSQISWLRENVDVEQKELYDWWMEHCSDIRQVGENLQIIESLGYEVLGHFTLPESAWEDGYYASLVQGIERVRKDHPGEKKAEEVIRMEREEQELYRTYSDWYGYEFYVMRKP